MKILFDCHTFDVGPQGTSTYLAGIINSINSNCKDNIEIWCAANEKKSVENFIHVDFNFVKIHKNFFLRNALSIPAATIKLNPDFIVSQYVRPIYAKNKTVSVIHDVLFEDYPEYFSKTYKTMRSLFFKWSARNSDIVFTVSDYSKNRISNLYGIDKNKIFVTANGLQFEAKKMLSRKTQKPHAEKDILRLIYVGRHEKRKRHEWCVDLCSDLIKSGKKINIKLVGSRDKNITTKILDNFEKMRGEKFSYDIIENISPEDLLMQYINSDLMIYPSKCEGFGIPIIEASALGLPCVIGNGSSFDELNEFFCGEFFLIDSQADFIEKCNLVANNINDYNKKAEKISAKIIEKFDWEKISSEFRKVLSNHE